MSPIIQNIQLSTFLFAISHMATKKIAVVTVST